MSGSNYSAGSISEVAGVLSAEPPQSPPRVASPSASMVPAQLSRRLRQIRSLWTEEGYRGISDRLRRTLAQRIAPSVALAPVRSSDLLEVDLADPFVPRVPRVIGDEAITVNWVITPPSPGSGGHTTIFRMLRHLEAHGYRNRVYFYDAYRGDHSYYESIVRRYYEFHGPVDTVDHGMADAHAVMATGWPTAYAVFNSRCAGKRFYFVQDFEPDFYPSGAISSLAACTYQMGYHGISIGQYVGDRLRAEFGMAVDSFPFGCDLARFHLSRRGPRSGVVFYARRDNARRGTELGLMALEALAQRRPDLEIHIYGDKLGPQPFRFIDHGRVSPEKINEIYNRCYAGLSLSFTNVSLAPLEMLAAGCIPVVNDMVQARSELANPFVRYAQHYPQAIAAQLDAVTQADDFDSLSAAAAASVGTRSWKEAGNVVESIVRRVLRESATE